MVEKILIKLLSLSIVLYFTSLIIFKTYNYQITYVIDIILVLLFLILITLKSISLQINKFIKLYAIFVLFCTASSLWAVDFYGSFFRGFQLFLLLINMIVIYNSIKIFNLKDVFINGILLGSLVNYLILFGFIHVSFEYISVNGGGRALGTMGNANMLAILMLISLFISIAFLNQKYKKNKFIIYYHYINLILSMYVIFLTMSKKGIIFGLILILIYLALLVKEPKKLILTLIFGILILTIVFNYIDIDLGSYYTHISGRFKSFDSQLTRPDPFGSTGERMFLIDFGLNAFQDKPLFGYGIANFFLLNDRHIYAHNNYVELLVDVGIFGTMLFYYIYIYLISNAYKLKDQFLKIIMITFLLILMMMDIALVSYGMKILIYTLLFISIQIETLSAKEKINGK